MNCIICTKEQVLLKDDLYKCMGCDHISSNKKGKTEIYDDLYIFKYKEYAHTPLGQNLVELRARLVREHLPKHSTLLDFGCGSGHFISELLGEYNIIGYDINPSSPWCKPSMLTLPWDAVTFWDSLEHTDDPKQTIVDILPQYIFIAVPCIDDFKEKDLTKWKHYRPHEHIHHFSEKSLRKLLEAIGYDILEVNFEEALLRRGYNGKNIITIVGRYNGKDKKTVG